MIAWVKVGSSKMDKMNLALVSNYKDIIKMEKFLECWKYYFYLMQMCENRCLSIQNYAQVSFVTFKHSNKLIDEFEELF